LIAGAWLRGYKEQVFLFTRDFNVDWTNNVSERGAKAAKRGVMLPGWQGGRRFARRESAGESRLTGRIFARGRKNRRGDGFSYTIRFIYLLTGVRSLISAADIVTCLAWRAGPGRHGRVPSAGQGLAGLRRIQGASASMESGAGKSEPLPFGMILDLLPNGCG
jgi:hypothetical protein